MKPTQSEQLKNKIIVDVLAYIDKPTKVLEERILINLKVLAKNYFVRLPKKGKAISTKVALTQFILNDEGYIVTIPKLYNSVV